MRFKDLSSLIGEEVTINRGLRADQLEAGFYREPDRIVIIGDYPETVLLRIYYPEHSLRRMVTKAAIYCGDEPLRHRGRKLEVKA